MLYDLAILGGGPAGVAAGVYASRKRLKTIFITETFGGQSVVSDKIENWIGTVAISGADLAKTLEAHLRAYAGDIVHIETGSRIKTVTKKGEVFCVETVSGKTFEAKTVLVATGSARKRLEVSGADQFEHKGLTYCATCDGPLFAGGDLVVIGGGNAAFESAAQLLAYAKTVTIINRSDTFRADEVTVEKISKHPNVRIIKNAISTEVKGDTFVTGFVYTDAKTGEKKEIPTSGIFVEIGSVPTTSFVKDIALLDSYGRVPVDPKTQKTKTPGLWAAGDCTDGLYHQNNIAVGDAVKALEDIYVELHTK